MTGPVLPTIALGPYRVTRLISGGNPLCGGSHWSPARSREMAEYHTPERVVAFLQRLVDCGVTTIQARGDYHRVLHWLELFRRQGGRIQWIAQTASEMADVFVNVRVLAAAGAIAIYHHGTKTDQFWAEGRIDRVLDYLKCIRDQGVAVGLGTHHPEVIEYAEAKGWDVDFYMAAFYNLNRTARQSELVTGAAAASPEPAASGDEPTVAEEYRQDDPGRMCEVIRRTPKPCLAFKILAAGRSSRTGIQARAAFRFALAQIKPTDAVVVGMWQKYRDEIGLNVEHVCQILAEPGDVPRSGYSPSG